MVNRDQVASYGPPCVKRQLKLAIASHCQFPCAKTTAYMHICTYVLYIYIYVHICIVFVKSSDRVACQLCCKASILRLEWPQALDIRLYRNEVPTVDDFVQPNGWATNGEAEAPSAKIKPYIIVIADQAQCWCQQASHKPKVRLDLRNPVRSRRNQMMRRWAA